MSHPHLALCKSSLRGGMLPYPQTVHVPTNALISQLARLDAPQGWVVLTGPGDHPGLLEVLTAARQRGLRTKLASTAHGLTPALLSEALDAGLEVLLLALHGPPSTHDTVTGIPGSGDHAVAIARAASEARGCKLELRTLAVTPTLPHLAAHVALAAELDAELHLEPLPRAAYRSPRLAGLAPRRKALTAAIAQAREAADASHVVLNAHTLLGPPSAPRPVTSSPAVGPNLWRLLRDDVSMPDTVGGCRASDIPHARLDAAADLAGSHGELALQLAAWRCPPVDLPPCLGGPGRHVADPAPPASWASRLTAEDLTPLPVWRAAPGKRVALLVPPMGDKVMTLVTMPALARAMRRRGADVRYHSVWGDDRDTAPVTSGPARRARQRDAAGAWSTILSELDLSDRDLVIVPGFDAGDDILNHPTLRPDARVVIADFHLLHGIDRWKARWIPAGRRSMDGGWWPDDRVHVHSCFPSFARLYRFAGVPQRQILWRPYPFDLGRFTPGPPPSECDHLFAGGNQKRDWASLAAASARLEGTGVHPIELYTVHAPDAKLAGPLTWRGTVDLVDFHEALRHARAVIVPVHWNRHAAAGLTVIAMALAAHRPVISTLTGGTLDHLRPGRDAALAPPANPKALARAIAHLDQDAGLLDRLSEGAAQAARRLSVARWAEELLDGAEPVRVVGSPGGPWFPW